MICPSCKSNNPDETRYCLNCGAAMATAQSATLQSPPINRPITPQPYSQQPTTSRTSGLAIAALILAIFSPCTIGVTGIVGIILGIIALVQISQPNNNMKGSGLAISGIIVSVVLPLLIFGIIIKFGLSFWKKNPEIVDVGMCTFNIQMLAQTATTYAQDHEKKTADCRSVLEFTHPSIR